MKDVKCKGNNYALCDMWAHWMVTNVEGGRSIFEEI